VGSGSFLSCCPFFLITLCAALPAGAEPTTITLWHAYRGGEQQAIEESIRRINGARADFQIVPVAVPNAAYASKLTSALPRGNGPDLFVFAHERIGGWAESGLLMRLETRIDEAELDRFFPETVEPLRFDGSLFGLPMSFKSDVLFYNTSLVEHPPDTTDELIEVASRLTDREAERFGLVYEVASFYHHAAWLHGFGGGVFGSDGSVDLETPENAASFAFVRDLVARYRVSPEDANGALVTEMFNAGRAAMAINGPWFLGEIGDDVPFAVAVLPVVSETGLRGRPFLTSEAVLVNAGTRHPELALEAALALTSDDSALVRALEGRQAVANRAVWSDPRLAGDPVLAVFRAQLPETVPMSNRPEMRSVWEPAQMALRRLLRGAATPEQALTSAQHHFRILTRPSPPEADPTPYWVALALLAAAGIALLWRRARASGVVHQIRGSLHAYAYLAPTALALVGLVFAPFVVATGVSLFAHRSGEWTFVGLRNFFWILSARDFGVTEPMSFYFTLGVTVVWTAVNVALHVSIGVFLAMLMRDLWAPVRGVYRVLLIIPWAVPNYITALIWRGMFHSQFGAINDLLELLGLPEVAWFSGFWTALAANICTNTWLGFPFMMVVTLGALQAIPRELEEAAAVDGAGRLARFRHVTLPLLKPALLPAVVLGSVWTFNMFNIVYLVSGGEPDGASEILISEAYRWAFTRQEQYGYASAYGVLVFISLLIYSRMVRTVTGEGKA
jgi:arabinogalactan oligomer/maltooligosaccharide transport system permease protein